MAHIIAVSGGVGAGKSTLAGALASCLADATVLRFDDYERITEQPIEEVRRWVETGADPDQLVVPHLDADLQALREGIAVRERVTGKLLPACRHVLLDTPFGRSHAATGRFIDYLVWIDTPLDVALARKIRQLSRDIAPSAAAESARFLSWLQGYLDNYVSLVHGILERQRAMVVPGADLVLDGMQEPGELLRRAAREIAKHFAARG